MYCMRQHQLVATTCEQKLRRWIQNSFRHVHDGLDAFESHPSARPWVGRSRSAQAVGIFRPGSGSAVDLMRRASSLLPSEKGVDGVPSLTIDSKRIKFVYQLRLSSSRISLVSTPSIVANSWPSVTQMQSILTCFQAWPFHKHFSGGLIHP